MGSLPRRAPAVVTAAERLVISPTGEEAEEILLRLRRLCVREAEIALSADDPVLNGRGLLWLRLARRRMGVGEAVELVGLVAPEEVRQILSEVTHPGV